MGLSNKPAGQANHPTRLICITATPHQKRGKGKKRGVVLRELNTPDNRRVKLRAKDELWKKTGRELKGPLSP